MSMFTIAGAPTIEEGDMELIYSETLTSDAATLSTGTLVTGFRSLIIDAVVCADSTGAGPGTLEVEFNGDNQQSNYQYSRAYWRNSIVGEAFDFPGAGIVTTKATSNRFAANRITVHNHERTNNYKSYIVSAQAINSASDKQYYAGLSIAGVWENTDAITSVIIRPFASFADFALGSSIAVYGLK